MFKQEPYSFYFINGIAYITYYGDNYVAEMSLDDIYTLTNINNINKIEKYQVNDLKTYIDNGVTTYSFVFNIEKFKDGIENVKPLIDYNDKTDSYKMIDNKMIIEFNENV